jgi:cytochrome P450
MECLFGISTTLEWRQRAIQIVGGYFKAWEFFLLTPEALYSKDEALVFKNACSDMLELSQEIYDMANSDENSDSEFISALLEQNTHIGVLQCIAEMLLAGTDTSSLTMFYTTLFLADHPEIANQISNQIVEGNIELAQKNIMYTYYESMRMIPVGPVILRQAEADIYENEFFLGKGEGVIFNIAGMNKGPPFTNPDQFDPWRYPREKLPLSFGLGKKSCVGRQFAEKEMKIFFTWFLKKYTVLSSKLSCK